MIKLTEKQYWVYNKLKMGLPFSVKPKILAYMYGEYIGTKGLKSNACWKQLVRLCELGLADRHKGGRYSYRENHGKVIENYVGNTLIVPSIDKKSMESFKNYIECDWGARLSQQHKPSFFKRLFNTLAFWR